MALANIIDNIATVLAGINGSAPYTTTVARVNEKPVNNFHVSGSNLPAVGITVETVDHGDPADVYEAMPRATISIDGWVQLTDGQAPHDCILPFWEDVKTSLRVDETRGNTVVGWYLQTSQFFYGENEAAFSIKCVAIYGEVL